MTVPQRLRVVVADDQNLFRSGLAALLAKDERLEVVAEASDGVEAIKRVADFHPDVVLMDLKMPNLDGVEATRSIKRDHGDTSVIILSSFSGDAHLIRALDAGANGYVLKDTSPESMADAIVAVSGGTHVVSSPLARKLMTFITSKPEESYDGLTNRQIDILKLVALGMANKQIAYHLKLSEKTVRNHISKIYAKLGLADRSQAVLYAARQGLIAI